MARLGDICDVRDGTHDSPSYISEGYPLVTSKNIVDGNLDMSDISYISLEDYNKINERSKVGLGDIIMPMIGTIGNPYIVGAFTDFAIKNVALIKFTNDIVYNRYIFHFLNSEKFKKYIADNNRGGTQKFLSLKDIRNIQLPLPPLAEQIDIVEKLDKVSDLISMRNKQFKKLDELVKSRFIEMFGDRGQNPFNYPTTTMGDVYKFQYGKGNNIPEDKGEYLCYGSNGVVGHHTEYNSEDSPIIGHIGAYAGIVNWGKGKHYVTYNGVICKLIHDKVNPVYGFYLLQLQDYNTVAKAGAAQPFVSYKDLEVPVVNIPSLEWQNQFATFVEHTDKSKIEIQKSLEKLETLKKALMQKYFG